MEAVQELCDRREGTVGLGPLGIRRQGHVTLDEHESLAAVGVDADRLGRAGEARGAQRAEEGMHRL